MEYRAAQPEISRILNFVGQLSRAKSPLIIDDLDRVVFLSPDCVCSLKVLKMFGDDERVMFALREVCEVVFEEKGITLSWDIKDNCIVGYDIEFGAVMVKMPIKS